MKVKIKQIAEAYHITRKGLHFYEEKGIVNPVRDENNSYMSLDIEDIYSIFRCRAYQKYGFSIKEISNIDKMYSLPEMREMLYSKYCTLQQEIQDKQRSADVILRQLENINLVEENYNKCSILRGFGLYYITFLPVGRGDTPHSLKIQDGDLERIKEWVNYVPNVASFKQYRGLSEDFSVTDATVTDFGYCFAESDRELCPVRMDERVSYLPPQTYVFSVVKGRYQAPDMEALFSHIREYFKENHLKLAGDPFSTMISSVFEDGCNQQYEAMWVPFAELKKS